VRSGGSAFYELCLNRRNHTGPVTIEAEDLPPGVTCEPVHVSPQGQFANVVITAAGEAPEWTGAFKLNAWAVVDGKKIVREVRPMQRRYPVANINTSVMLREICFAVRDKAPYALHLPKELHKVAAGQSIEMTAKVTRLWPEFKGSVQLTGLILPPGFSMATTNIAPGAAETAIKLNVAANVPPGDYSVVVRGDAQVPYNRDPIATARPNVRVTDPSTPAHIIVLPKADKK
jgi:hypothetical protein